MCYKSKSGFWVLFEKYRRWGVQIFLRTQKQFLLDRLKFVCTSDDLAKLEDLLNENDVIESCIGERRNTKWRFYNLTNSRVFAALLKNIPLCCKDAVLPQTLSNNHTVNSLTYGENTRQPYRDCLCLFRTFPHHLHGNQRLEEKTPKIFNLFTSRMDGLTRSQFQRVHMNGIPFVEDLLLRNILLYDIDFVEEKFISKLARRSVRKHENTARLLRYNNHICYVSKNNTIFHNFWCHDCDTFSNRTPNLEWVLPTCSKRVKQVYPRNLYRNRETDKLDSFGIKYKSEQKSSKN